MPASIYGCVPTLARGTFACRNRLLQRLTSSAVTEIGLPNSPSRLRSSAISQNNPRFSKKRSAVARGGESALRRPRRVTATVQVSLPFAMRKNPVRLSALNSAEATQYPRKEACILPSTIQSAARCGPHANDFRSAKQRLQDGLAFTGNIKPVLTCSSTSTRDLSALFDVMSALFPDHMFQTSLLDMGR
jgi:hypothetical protein